MGVRGAVVAGVEREDRVVVRKRRGDGVRLPYSTHEGARDCTSGSPSSGVDRAARTRVLSPAGRRRCRLVATIGTERAVRVRVKATRDGEPVDRVDEIGAVPLCRARFGSSTPVDRVPRSSRMLIPVTAGGSDGGPLLGGAVESAVGSTTSNAVETLSAGPLSTDTRVSPRRSCCVHDECCRRVVALVPKKSGRSSRIKLCPFRPCSLDSYP